MTKYDLSIIKMVLVDAFAISYSFNEVINTSLYFFPNFLKNGFVWSLILWVFGYELIKLLIINNNKVPCNNLTAMNIYKRIFVFITVTFN